MAAPVAPVAVVAPVVAPVAAPVAAPVQVAKPISVTSDARLMLVAIAAALVDLSKNAAVRPTLDALSSEEVTDCPESTFVTVMARTIALMSDQLAVDPLQRNQGVPGRLFDKLNAFLPPGANPTAKDAIELLCGLLTKFLKCIACRAVELAYDHGRGARPRPWSLSGKWLCGIIRSFASPGGAAETNRNVGALVDYMIGRSAAALEARAAARAAKKAAVEAEAGAATDASASAESDEDDD